MENKTERIILGIDPGTNVMGYGVISVSGRSVAFIEMDAILMSKLPDHFLKLKRIFEETVHIIEKFKPDEVALEAPFYGKNVQSMLKLGRAQGISMAAALHRNLPVFEYSPRKVKQSITGKGTASKEQVAAMLKRILSFGDLPKKLDATDAIAVAVCHYFQNRVGEGGTARKSKKWGSWGAFAAGNSERITGQWKKK